MMTCAFAFAFKSAISFSVSTITAGFTPAALRSASTDVGGAGMYRIPFWNTSGPLYGTRPAGGVGVGPGGTGVGPGGTGVGGTGVGGTGSGNGGVCPLAIAARSASNVFASIPFGATLPFVYQSGISGTYNSVTHCVDVNARHVIVRVPAHVEIFTPVASYPNAWIS